MSTELVRNRSFIATGNMAPGQFHFVRIDTSGGISFCGEGAYAIGVLQDKPAAGDAGAVCSPGDLTKIKCGGHITAGEFIMSSVSGRAIAATSGAFILGQAMEAGENDDVIQMMFVPIGDSSLSLDELVNDPAMAVDEGAF